ncbi:response regulator transcription factor [Solobacterium moorei]|uniref:Response regulator receiver domain protein n=1 Tax=Solobacterium moorei F0204 TaxID=706433 RepID=E7MM01_9FIRM|nr:response regulator transcription factor [Solobacterium moorei]EFW24842.1 response regulator receiver domain protein [Solobacterium moorei F0204]
MTKILLVEDDFAIVHSLQEYLNLEGFSSDYASGQKEAEQLLKTKQYQLLLLDVSLKDGDGFAVCNMAQKIQLPVIFLSASSDEETVVRGLNIGADDYITKPFRPKELLSRIKNVLRRHTGHQTIILLDEIQVDIEKAIVKKKEKEINLSALEYKLLTLFIDHRGKLLTRDQLLDEIWNIAGDFVNDNTITVYIKRLREKIEDDPTNPKIIKTVRGLGYRMD